jgi:hypothetical protein
MLILLDFYTLYPYYEDFIAIETETLRTSNLIGKFANENHRFSSSLFSRLITLVLFQFLMSLIMRSVYEEKRSFSHFE